MKSTEGTYSSIKPFVFLIILILLDISFLRMLPQGYDDVRYWGVIVTLGLLTCLLYLYWNVNRHAQKSKTRILSLNQLMDESCDLEEYFHWRDACISCLQAISKHEIFISSKNRLPDKPSKLLSQISQNEEASIQDALVRITANYKLRVFKEKRNFSGQFEQEIAKYSDRLSSQSKYQAALCLHILQQYEKVVGKIEEADTMDGHTFEHWCADLLTKNGFADVTVTQASGDQGVDILAVKDGIHYAIQCKCYTSDLGNKPVQEVYAGKEMYACQVGVVMTNRYFTAGAKQLAEKTRVLLWDRDKLAEMLGLAQ